MYKEARSRSGSLRGALPANFLCEVAAARQRQEMGQGEFFRGGDYQPRPGPYAHMHRAVCGQRARPAEAALARAGWTGVYMTRSILRDPEGVRGL